MQFDPKPQPCDVNGVYDVDPAARGISDRYFVNVRTETYRSVRSREQMVFATPWGPRFDLLFDPKGASHLLGGTLRVLARTAGTEVEIARIAIASVDTPIALSASLGCDEYVVTAASGSEPPGGARPLECYFFARVYAAS